MLQACLLGLPYILPFALQGSGADSQDSQEGAAGNVLQELAKKPESALDPSRWNQILEVGATPASVSLSHKDTMHECVSSRTCKILVSKHAPDRFFTSVKSCPVPVSWQMMAIDPSHWQCTFCVHSLYAGLCLSAHSVAVPQGCCIAAGIDVRIALCNGLDMQSCISCLC